MLAGRPVAVTGSDDGTVRVWDLTTHQPVGEPLTGHADEVLAVATGALAGRPVAVTSSWDETLRVWDLATGRTPHRPHRLGAGGGDGGGGRPPGRLHGQR
ncbi:hypothetical protein [Streptomyces sp. NPDC018352]|uniref:hypothetical protein n=1 Tax=Streptomyces sp. NPDC018352 TaxID=3157194 RepID=UPI0033C387E9